MAYIPWFYGACDVCIVFHLFCCDDTTRSDGTGLWESFKLNIPSLSSRTGSYVGHRLSAPGKWLHIQPDKTMGIFIPQGHVTYSWKHHCPKPNGAHVSIYQNQKQSRVTQHLTRNKRPEKKNRTKTIPTTVFSLSHGGEIRKTRALFVLRKNKMETPMYKTRSLWGIVRSFCCCSRLQRTPKCVVSL